MQKITPCLWFDDNAEEAVNHYCAIFKNAGIGRVLRCGESGPGPKGSALTMTFQLEGQQFIALNGGPIFKFNQAISLSVDCKAQEEVDELWKKLSYGGQEIRCGWLKDKFGLSWQIVPTAMIEMLQDQDEARSARVMAAMMQMNKIDIKTLMRAYTGNRRAGPEQ